jgi:hypothetical protein
MSTARLAVRPYGFVATIFSGRLEPRSQGGAACRPLIRLRLARNFLPRLRRRVSPRAVMPSIAPAAGTSSRSGGTSFSRKMAVFSTEPETIVEGENARSGNTHDDTSTTSEDGER